MNQRGQVHHLDDDCRPSHAVVPAAGTVRREAGQRRSKLFALPRQRVLRVWRNLWIKRRQLLSQLLLNPIEKRRNGEKNLRQFNTGILRGRGVRKRGRLGSSGNHARKNYLLAKSKSIAACRCNRLAKPTMVKNIELVRFTQ